MCLSVNKNEGKGGGRGGHLPAADQRTVSVAFPTNLIDQQHTFLDQHGHSP